MRVLFTTFAARSHLNALVPLAWALQTAGHQVCVASQPDLADHITGAGLTAVPVGPPLLLDERVAEADDANGDQAPAETDPEKLTWDYLHGVFSAMTPYVYEPFNGPEMIDDLVAFARFWQPDLVIWDPLTFAGPVVARVCAAAHARLLFGLDLQGLMRDAFVDLLGQRPAASRDDPLRAWLESTLRRHGATFDETVVVGQASIDVTPTSLRLPVDLPYIPVRYVPYNGPAVVPGWLREQPARSRVCLTLGVSHREVQGGDRVSIGDILDAVADLDIEVVATLDAEQLASLDRVPDNVRAVDFVPLNALLPTCSAIISHGGSGSFHTALTHGVPQVIVPAAMWDERIKARRLQDAGAGICVEKLTAVAVREHLLQVLEDPSYAHNAAALRTEMVGTPGPNDIVPALERLVAEHTDARA
ncbi:MAG TPA: activator-dependent family glycosyltransferase [Catenuloplanes sp.]|jgi:L-2-deoxyfucosyltransferase